MHFQCCRLKFGGFVLIFCLWLFGSPYIAAGADNPLKEMDPMGYPAPSVGCLAPEKCHDGFEIYSKSPINFFNFLTAGGRTRPLFS